MELSDPIDISSDEKDDLKTKDVEMVEVGVAVLHVPIGYVDPVQENDHRAYDQSKLKIKKNLKMKLILRFHNVEKVLEFADQSFLKRKMKLKIKLKIRHCHRVLDHVRK